MINRYFGDIGDNGLISIIDLNKETSKKIYNLTNLKHINPVKSKLEGNPNDLDDLINHMNLQNQKYEKAVLNVASINVRNKELVIENKNLKEELSNMKFKHTTMENEIIDLKQTIKEQLDKHYFKNIIIELDKENEWRKEYQRTLESKIRRLKRQIRRFEGVE